MKFNPRHYWRVEQLWPWLFLFLATFFLAPSGKAHNNLFYISLLLPTLILIRWDDVREFLRNPLLASIGLLLSYLWLSCWWSVNSQPSEIGKEAVRLGYLLIFSICVTRSMEYRPELLHRMLMFIVLAASAGAMISMYQHFSAASGDIERLLLIAQERRLSYFGRLDHNVIGASAYGVATLMAVLITERSQSLKARAFWGVSALLCGMALILSYSRGAIVATLLCIVMVLALHHRRWVGFVVLIGLVLAWAVSGLDPGNMLVRGVGLRPEIWQVTIERISIAPWFGNGLLVDETIALAQVNIDHPHSAILATFFYGGLVGGGLLICTLHFAFLGSYKLGKHGNNWTALVLLIYAILIVLTDNDKLLTSPKPLWLYFWFPVLLCSCGFNEKSARVSKAK